MQRLSHPTPRVLIRNLLKSTFPDGLQGTLVVLLLTAHPIGRFLQEAAASCQEMHFNKAQQLMDWNKSVPAELRKLTV